MFVTWRLGFDPLFIPELIQKIKEDNITLISTYWVDGNRGDERTDE